MLGLDSPHKLALGSSYVSSNSRRIKTYQRYDIEIPLTIQKSISLMVFSCNIYKKDFNMFLVPIIYLFCHFSYNSFPMVLVHTKFCLVFLKF